MKFNNYKLALGLATLALLSAAVGCGDDPAFDDVAEEGEDVCRTVGILTSVPKASCGASTNRIVLSAPTEVNGTYPVQLAGFEPSAGEVIHVAEGVPGSDTVTVHAGSDTSQGSLSVSLEREGNDTLATEFTGLYDDMVRARTTPGDEIQAGVADLDKLNFYFSGSLLLDVVQENGLRAQYRTSTLGFAQQHVGSKNDWWIGHLDFEAHGPDYSVLGELIVEAQNPEDPSDIVNIFIRPRSNSSDQFDLSAVRLTPVPTNDFIRQEANGDVVYSITVDAPMSVQLFVRETGDVEPFLMTSELQEADNADGTLTYSFTDSASNFEDGDEIEVRFVTSLPDTEEQFVPGPDDSVWSDPFLVSEAL